MTIVFSAGAEAIDLDKKEREELANRIIEQLRIIARGAQDMQSRRPAVTAE